MNIGVARQAAAAHCLRFWIRADANVLTRLQSACVAVCSVTLLAKYGYWSDQQRTLIRSVRRMAVQTAFSHRRVLPQPWPPLLCVTLIAGFVDRVRLKQRAVQQRIAVVSQCAVGVVTVVATHLPFG